MTQPSYLSTGQSALLVTTTALASTGLLTTTIADASLPDQILLSVTATNARALWRLDKTSALTIDGVTVVATQSGTGRWVLNSRYSGFVPVNECGAAGNGATDDTAAIQAALNALAGTGITLTFHGTYIIGTVPGIVVPSGSRMRAVPGAATLRSTMAPAGAFPGHYVFSGIGTLFGSAGTLNGTPTIGSRTAAITITSTPVAGMYIYLSHNESAQMFQISAPTNTGGNNWTVTLDEPIAYPFVGGDAATLLSSITSDVYIDGLTFAGTGDQSCEWAYAQRIIMRNVQFSPAYGTLGAVIGFDIGSRDCLLEDFSFDLTGSVGNQSGWYLQSNARTTVRKGKVFNAALFGGALLDCYACGAEDCHFPNSNSGLRITRFSLSGGTATLGNFDCWVLGGSAIGSGNGLDINGSTAISVYGFSARYCSSQGITIDTNGNNDGLLLHGCDVSNCATGFNLGSGNTNTKLHGLQANNCTTNAIALASECDIRGIEANCNLATVGVISVNTTGTVKIEGKVTQNNATGYGIIISAAGRVEIDSMPINGACAVGLYVNAAASVTVRNVVIPSAGQALFTAAGALVKVYSDCNFDGSTLPLYTGSPASTVALQQSGMYTDATTTGTVTLTQKQAFAQIMKFAQSLTGNITYTVPAGPPGFWTVDLVGVTLNAHTFTIIPVGGTMTGTLTAAQHLIYSDGVNSKVIV